VPLDAQPLDTSCFDRPWENASVSLANTLKKRQRILEQHGIGAAHTEEEIQKATERAHKLNPLDCRERIVDFLRWQTSTRPELPLHLVSKPLDDKVLNERPSLSIIHEVASRIITSGFVGE
jgi:hypothetical protein